ncbi:hypothetical protein CC2G_015288 [Coprinopsis cinerea AmutBmut pab1-1]|nr:hypothetical protein CC2G_015288 [Coprinopsis cinerea AmutBmut pab1-1]
MFQNRFMRCVLADAVVSWDKDAPELVGQHGGVTDGNHSFFRNGTLVATAVYDTIIQTWVPVLYTWVHKLDTEHHLPHFRKIAHQIVDICQEKGLELKDEFLLHVFDFAQAEHAAHAESFVEAKIRMFSNWHHLSPEAQAIQRAEWLKMAEKYQVGCRVHFKRSANRIQSSHSLVPPEDGTSFMSKIHQLLSKKTSTESFDSIINDLAATYPRITGWLSWWLRSRIASLIFPAKSLVEPHHREKVPNSSNVIESIHHLTNHAVGKEHDIVSGAESLLIHSRELEAQRRSIQDGHNEPLPPRSPQKPRKPVVPVDDSVNGRAPDTVERLGLPPSVPQDQVSRSTSIREVELLAYVWNGRNSCFWDSGLELLYRAYCCWPEDEAQRFRLQLIQQAKSSFLTWMFFHFHNRRMRVEENQRRKLRQELLIGQQKMSHYIFDKWELLPHGSYGSVTMWLPRALKDGSPPLEIQAHLGIQQLANLRCSSGHLTSFYSPETPIVCHSVSAAYVHALTLNVGHTISIGNYLTRWIPNTKESVDSPLHVHHGVADCSQKSCSHRSSFVEATISWPRILCLSTLPLADGSATPKAAYPSRPTFDNKITIMDDEGTVTYELVGRSIFHHEQQHFTSQVRFRNKTFTYDDITSGGDTLLLPSTDDGLLQSTVQRDMLYVYYRTSTKASTRRSKEAILSDHQLLTALKAPVMVRKTGEDGESVYETESDNDSLDSVIDFDLGSMADVVKCTEAPIITPDVSQGSITHTPSPLPPQRRSPSIEHDDIQEIIVCTNRESKFWCEKEDNQLIANPLDLRLVSCPQCSEEYHFVCIKDLLPSTCTLPSHLSNAPAIWCCLACQYGPDSTLDALLMGQTVLVVKSEH